MAATSGAGARRARAWLRRCRAPREAARAAAAERAALDVRQPRTRRSAAVRALTAAALALPGLAPSPARCAEGDGLRLQYGHYGEGDRHIGGLHSAFDPLRVDSLDVGGRFGLLERWKLGVHYAQDTWSGATPVATAPGVMRGNHSSAPDGVSSATPILKGEMFLDSALRPIALGALGEPLGPRSGLVHTLTSASPETRGEGELDLGYEWDGASLELGAGLSRERDYESRFHSLRATWDFGQRLTSLSLGLSRSRSSTRALLDHDAVPYIDTGAFLSQIRSDPGRDERTLRGLRRDWSAELGATRVLSRGALLEAGTGFTRSSGYLENPYKAVEIAFIDPDLQGLAPPGTSFAQVRALLEQRPDVRRQWTASLRFVQYVEPLGASLHLGYRYYRDDWGIGAHSAEASWAQPLGGGWTLTPRARFYAQGPAEFYHPYLVSRQAYQHIVSDPDTGEILSDTRYDPRRLPSAFSSDARLAGYGALSAGLTLSTELRSGVRLELDGEYYRHAGQFALGSQRELQDGADFRSYLVSASVTLDGGALRGARERALPLVQAGADERVGLGLGHSEHAGHAGAHGPAGVMLDHMLAAGESMVSARYAFMRQGGALLRGADEIDDAAVIGGGCGAERCRSAPERMDMQMRMVDFMYAPSDWLNLMLMGQFMDMDMDFAQLAGAPPDAHALHEHHSGGVGDTSLYALLRLFVSERHELHLGLGVSAPTGDVGVAFRRTHQENRGLTHYGMQLGSGTWDLLPSLTYSGRGELLSWGAQLAGTRRLEPENRSGYALGDAFQGTVWTSLRISRWLELSARLAYSAQGPLRGEYDRLHPSSGPMHFPRSYGGRYWDAGFGASLVIPSGQLAGNRLSLEWLEPLRDDVRGFQLERRGALFGVWSADF